MEGKDKRRGRPPKFAGERRGSLTIRLRDRVRDDLEKAAEASGRSLSEETEYRLEIALSHRDYLIERWGEDVFQIAEGAARSLSHIERWTGQRWIEDRKTFELFAHTMGKIIENYRSVVLIERRDTPVGELDGKSDQELAEMFAGLGGISPPRPLKPHACDFEKEHAKRVDSIGRWKRLIDARGSRPLEKGQEAIFRAKSGA